MRGTKRPLEGGVKRVLIENIRGVSRVVQACFHHLTRVSNVEPFSYEDECSFFHLGFFTLISKMGTSSRLEVNSIEFRAKNLVSSCVLAHGFRKGDERHSLPHIEA